jgi:peptidyl-prolyl cis-trans isomerase SurA
MKKFLLILFINLVVGQRQTQYIDGVAALVEDHLILKSDLAQMINMTALQNRIDPNVDPEKFISLQKKILENMVNQKVILKMAEVDSVFVDEKEVDTSLEQQVDILISQAGGKKKAEESLGQSINDFKREFWYDMRDRLVSEKYQQQVINTVTVTRPDVINFYKTYKDSLPLIPLKTKIRHLLVPIKPSDSSINKVKREISFFKESIVNKTSNFEDLAKKHSIDPGSKKLGGSLGWVSRGSLVKSFEKAAFGANEGELVGPIQTDFGFHLIQTQEKKGDKIRVRHILLKPEITDQDREKAYNFATNLQRDSIKSLDDFNKYVQLYTSDESTKKIGGNLGWIDPNTYAIPEIGKAISYIEKNTCSPPINSNLGYHLLWIENVKPGGRANLDNHWYDIENLALSRKKMNFYNDWLLKAKEDIFIKVFN